MATTSTFSGSRASARRAPAVQAMAWFAAAAGYHTPGPTTRPLYRGFTAERNVLNASVSLAVGSDF